MYTYHKVVLRFHFLILLLREDLGEFIKEKNLKTSFTLVLKMKKPIHC